MSTLPPPFVNEFPADSIEKQVYNLVESFAPHLPVTNDRYRLAYSLFKYVNGEGDPALVSLKAAKVTLSGISIEGLAAKLDEGLLAIKK